MKFSELCYYIAIDNPVNNLIIRKTSSWLNKGTASLNGSVPKNFVGSTQIGSTLCKLAGNNYIFVRLAGLSGVMAIVLGAIGSHTLIGPENNELKQVFDTANRYHFFHSLALLSIPLTKRPFLIGVLMIPGVLMFSGTLYYRALTGCKPKYPQLAPIGAILLVTAWFSLIF